MRHAMTWLRIGCLVSVAVIACHRAPVATTEAPAASPPPDPRPAAATPIEGIDTSHFDGPVDWSAVAASGVRFVYLKATEGVDDQDSRFADDWPAVQAAGLLRGAYHFFRANDDAATQAKFFLATVPHAPGDLPPALDVEVTADQTAATIVAGVRTWLTTVETALGVKPVLYTGPSFWDTLDTDAFGDYPLWIAEYGVDQPKIPAGWETWTFWQYSQKGTVDGIESAVDLDRFAGDEAMLEAMRLK